MHKLVESYLTNHPKLAEQLVIGIWNIEFLERAKKLFTNFKFCFIGISFSAAQNYFLDNVDCLSLPFAALAGSDGQSFIKEAHVRNKRVFTWTINDPLQMKTCVLWQIDGVVGDNVRVLLENVHEIPKALSNDEAYQEFVKTDTYLSSRRRRAYLYMVTKLMNLASWKVIGV